MTEARTISIEAYIYLYPLITMEMTRRQATNVPGGERPGSGPMGEFWHIREFPPADFRGVVRPNFDTLYSSAWVDLTGGPVLVSAPDTDGRYYLLPMLDMWTDVFAVPGRRTTGTGEGRWAIVPERWEGELPEGVDRIDAPTLYVWIIGRTQTDGPADYDAVREVQDGFALERLDGVDHASTHRHDPSVDMDTPPLEQVNGMPGRDYFSLAAELLRFHPPHVTDWSIFARMRRIGLRVGESFDYDSLDAETRQAIDEAPATALGHMHASVAGLAKIVNGWQMNTDTFGVYGNSYLKRAIVSMVGLGANPPEDAIYPLAVSDADGKPLDGNNDYVMHFERSELPPVGAFWSVTMYDAQGFPAANAINRFAIGDRDELEVGEDGSLDIYLQHENPGPQREANWLPAPRGPLGVTMRLYDPAPAALDGRWNPPPIRRVN